MNLKHWSLPGMIGVAILIGCSAKKPPVVPPPEPPPKKVVEFTPPPPPPPPPSVDTAALNRERIQARITEAFKTVYFEYDQSTLTADGKNACDVIGQLMKDVSEITVRIEGHADERGTNEYNLALGERRAISIQAYLTSYGVAASRFSVISYGEEKPAVDGHDEAAWSKNRRVEFTPTF